MSKTHKSALITALFFLGFVVSRRLSICTYSRSLTYKRKKPTWSIWTDCIFEQKSAEPQDAPISRSTILGLPTGQFVFSVIRYDQNKESCPAHGLNTSLCINCLLGILRSNIVLNRWPAMMIVVIRNRILFSAFL